MKQQQFDTYVCRTDDGCVMGQYTVCDGYVTLVVPVGGDDDSHHLLATCDDRTQAEAFFVAMECNDLQGMMDAKVQPRGIAI